MGFSVQLALRAGNEKDEDQADTVGCCSLRVEHIALHEEKDGKLFCLFNYTSTNNEMNMKYKHILYIVK